MTKMARIVKTSQTRLAKKFEKKNARRLRGAILTEKPNIMLRHNVINVNTICPSGLQGWSSKVGSLSFKGQSFTSS